MTFAHRPSLLRCVPHANSKLCSLRALRVPQGRSTALHTWLQALTCCRRELPCSLRCRLPTASPRQCRHRVLPAHTCSAYARKHLSCETSMGIIYNIERRSTYVMHHLCYALVPSVCAGPASVCSYVGVKIVVSINQRVELNLGRDSTLLCCTTVNLALPPLSSQICSGILMVTHCTTCKHACMPQPSWTNMH